MPVHSLFDLSGKVALLTGASRGMGYAMAAALGQAGAKVVISGLEPDECLAAEAALRAEGIEACAVACDVGDRQQVGALFAAACQRYGQVDILVCNAGIGHAPGPLAATSDADWEQVMRINLQSQLWLTSLAIPPMAARGDGAVILTASLSSVRGNKGIGLYGLSKAGVAQLARNLAVEWGPHNVRVNAISPGVIRTRFAGPMLDDATLMARRIAQTPLRRVGEVKDVAGMTLLLASAAGSFITGQNLIIDGGTTISDGN
ncbi:SDR family NAD(P)-dependent oxidoreductase [Vogesella facilis]|uniref:SDR family NAD(P)-dependent oxidoreductase n=1 Tax=Vogesella facilis TaxID=1655232 RepID=A0ABV7REE7_9NEIS